MRTEAGWLEARVMNMRPCEVATSHDADTSTTVEMMRLGLLRLGEARRENEKGAGWLERIDFKSLRVSLASIGLSAGGALAMTLAIVAGGLFVIWALEDPNRLITSRDEFPIVAPKAPRKHSRIVLENIVAPQVELGHPDPTPPSLPSSRPATRPPRDPLPAADASRDLLPAGESRDLLPADESRDLLVEDALSQDVVSAPRPEALLEPEVARLLALEPEQLTQLHRLAEEHQALDRLNQQESVELAAQPPEGNVAAVALGDAAVDPEIGARALAVLDDRQRNLWLTMLRDAEDATTKTGSHEPSHDSPRVE